MESEKLGLPLLAIYSLFWGIAFASGNPTLIPVLIMTAFFAYAFFKRQVTNMIYANFPRLKNNYVVVFFIKNANKKPLKWLIIPDETGYGIIEKGRYNLEKKNALPDETLFAGRLHFIVEEGNPIPVQAEIHDLTAKVIFKYQNKLYFEAAQGYKLSEPDHDRLKTWAFTVQRALVTTWFKILYAEVRQWAFMIAIVVAIIALAVSIYEFQYIQSVNPLVQTIYQRTIIENGSILIHQGKP